MEKKKKKNVEKISLLCSEPLLAETTRSVKQSFDPNTPIFNGKIPNASYLRWPAWIIKFKNPQIFYFNFSLQKLSSHKKRLL